ncbi:MAG: hypothetical protein ACR2GC_07245 [Methyloceanibacter sp.]|uniref:hypothetical protein n=1 Tax=Methyloceanibacter sp. TaxID=1965321 RepID=UPI003D9AFEF6
MTTAPKGAAPEEIKSDLNTADDITPREASQPKTGQLIDRYGHHHSESIFTNWTPAAIKALGIRRMGAA